VKPVVGESAPKTKGERLEFLGSHGDDQTDRHVGQPSKRELQYASRRGVHPLRVIDGNQKWTRRGESLEDPADAGRDRQAIGWRSDGLRAKESDVKSRPLRRRKSFQIFLEDSLEEVAQGGE
jgi:hypothetical protein